MTNPQKALQPGVASNNVPSIVPLVEGISCFEHQSKFIDELTNE
jgi:hypothetical protein